MKTINNNLKQKTMSTIKKTTVVLALLFMGIITINAQDGAQLGIKGGVNFAKLKNADGKGKIGMVAGIFMEKKLSDRFSIRPEALFSTQGAKIGSQKTKLKYINIPVLAKIYPTERFSVEFGPQVGYLLGKKGGNLRKKDYRKLDYSLALGTGFHISDNLELGARYNLGLRDITKTPGKIKNSVFQFTVSYKF